LVNNSGDLVNNSGDLVNNSGNTSINIMQQCLQHITRNMDQIYNNFIESNTQILSIHKIKGSLAETFVSYARDNFNLEYWYIDFEHEYSIYIDRANELKIETYQINEHLVMLKGIILEDIIPLVTDSIWHLTHIDNLHRCCSYLSPYFLESQEIHINAFSAICQFG
jgi:hypothetical protein